MGPRSICNLVENKSHTSQLSSTIQPSNFLASFDSQGHIPCSNGILRPLIPISRENWVIDMNIFAVTISCVLSLHSVCLANFQTTILPLKILDEPISPKVTS